MSFTPILPYGGSDGWAYLKKTLDAQKEKADLLLPTLNEIDLAHFRDTIATADSAADLVNDRRNLRVAMRAFGLGDAIPSEAFVTKMLETSTLGADALDRFPDARWFELSKAFGFGDAAASPKPSAPGFADDIATRYRVAQFEEAVGAADPAMRAALAFDRAVSSLAEGKFSEEDGWARALADDNALRVFRTAFGLGASFDAQPREAQIKTLREAAEALTGARKVDAFADEKLRDAALKLYFDKAKTGFNLASLGFSRPKVTGEGATAWRFLQSSLDTQQAGFARATANDAELRYFARKIADATSAKDLVADERLLKTALEAFGLGDQRPTAEFVERVLAGGVDDPTSFANSLADPRWREMAAFFGYGDGQGARVREFGFAEDFAARWRIAGFEEAVGAQDADMRRALIFDRAMETIANSGLGRTEELSRALGHPTLSLVLQGALDLPDDFSTRSASDQTALVREGLRAVTGRDDLSALKQERVREDLIRRYLSDATARPERRGGLGQPLIPLGGIAGWEFLQRTLPEQRAAFEAADSNRREIDHFRANIAKIETAEDLMADRRLLSVALEAFGLIDEIDKRAFIEQALAGGTEDPRALAARLVDPRYREMAAAFGFGDAKGAQTGVDGFADMVLARYRARAFERAVGETDETMRLGLNFDRAAEALTRQNISETAGWFRLLGDPPMRSVLEGALGLPAEFSQIDIEKQAEVVRARVQRLLGSDSFRVFADGEKRDAMIRQFLVREQIASGGTAGPVPGQSALLILQSAQGAGGGLNLLL